MSSGGDNTVHIIKTDLDPQWVDRIGMAIFSLWVDFALGRKALGGRRLAYPTGRYASSIQFQKEGNATVGIIANTDIAPEAAIIEHGHIAFDLKKSLTAGRGYPMHRFRGEGPRVARGRNLLRTGGEAAFPSRTRGRSMLGGGPKMWAEIRRSEASGFASFGPNSDPDSWQVPAMPAYSPAAILSKMAQDMMQKLG